MLPWYPVSVGTRIVSITHTQRFISSIATSLIAWACVGGLPAWAQTDSLQLPPPSFPDAQELQRAGRVDEAIAQLERTLPPDDADQSPEALVLRATLHDAAAQPIEAERLWRSVIEREVWMRTFARRALVSSLAARGAPSDAEPILIELSRSDPIRHLDLALQVADAYRAAGEDQGARRLYGTIVRRQPRGGAADTARLAIAATLESDGDVDGALAELRTAKRLHRRADTFERAAAAERRIARATGRSVAPLSEVDYRSLTRRLRRASRHDLALELITEWRSAYAPADGDARIELKRIETLYAQRANSEAAAACRDFYTRFPDSALLPDVKLTEFRIAVRQVDTERARQLGLELWEGRVRGTSAEHRWNAGNLLAAHLVAVGDVDGGLVLYPGLFQAARSNGDRRVILWRAGVAALRAGQHDRAKTNLRALVDRGPTGDLVPAGLYWLARAERDAEPARASRRLDAVAQRFPYHYYGARARQELARLDGGNTPPLRVEPTTRFPDLAITDVSRGRAEYRAAMLLARAGLTEDAAWYLDRLLARRRGDRGLALLTIRASAAAGDYARVMRLLVNHFGRFLQVPASGLPDDFWELVYPRPFLEDVSAAGHRHGVDPLLLTSLMRQESRFDADARSPVGAIGLFQVMTYTAEALADSAGVADVVSGGSDVGDINDAVLAEPAVNALLGARLAGNLIEMFDGAVPPVAASYNAGEERAAGWWAAAMDLPEDLFVDTIPYTETRRFVREVLTNYWAYQRIYADQ